LLGKSKCTHAIPKSLVTKRGPIKKRK